MAPGGRPCHRAYTGRMRETLLPTGPDMTDQASDGVVLTCGAEPVTGTPRAARVAGASVSEPGRPLSDPDSGVSTGTAVLEREELQSTDDGDADRFAHYVRKDKIAAAAVTGRPVVALCGKVWTPGRDPSKYPVCPTCKQIYEQMRPGGDGQGGPAGSGPRRPRFPFGRGGK